MIVPLRFPQLTFQTPEGTGGEESATELRNRYYKEVAAIVKEKLKCDKVICFHHQVRNQDQVKGGSGVQGYTGGGP